MATSETPREAASPPLVDLVFERAGVGLCLVAPNDTVLRTNAEWLRGTGLRLEQAIGRNVHDLFPEARDFGRSVHEQVRAGQTVRVPPRPRRVEGRETWWEGSFSPVPMAGGTGILIAARDVTHEVAAQSAADAERRCAEAALREHRKLLQSITDAIPCAIAVVDGRELRVQWTNPAAQELLDEPLRTAGVAGLPVQEFLRDPQEHGIVHFIQDVARTGQSCAMRYWECHGLWRGPMWWRLTFVPLPRMDGLWDVLAVIDEITEKVVAHQRAVAARVDAEARAEALRLAEQRLRTGSLDFGVALFQQDMQLRYTSILSSQPEHMRPNLGHTDEEIFGPEEGSRLMQLKREVLCTGVRFSGEISVHDGGALHWFQVVLEPLRDPMGKITGLIGAELDITARKKAEAERELYLAQLRAVIDEMPALVYLADASGRCVAANRKLDQTFGESTCCNGKALEDFKDLWKMRRLDGRPVPFQEWPLVRSLRNGETIDREEFLYLRKETPAFLSISSVPLFAQDGHVEGGVAVAWDVTEQKEVERKLREATATLEEANRHKDQFVAMLAHELRNPLAAMNAATQLVRRRLASGQAVDHHLAVLERQIRNSSRLLDDLLDVSRISRHMVQLKKEIVRLDTVVASAVESQRAFIEKSRHRLRVTLPQPPVLLEADPTRLEQIVSNLLNNAAKYTPEGGEIELNAQRDEGDAVVIRVKDSGVGLSPELLDRVFDAFVQADRSLARDKGGLGLGLALVRQLTEMHGGSVEARSEGTGKGSEFIVRLPARPDLGMPAPAPARAADRAKKHRRILLVEDNADTAALMAEHLMMLGHDVSVALDGPSGLATAERVHPEIALLDIGLPGFDGYELARRLRGPEAPVLVALSGYGQEEYKSRAQEAGFSRYLTKPVDPDALERLIDNLASG